MQSWEGHIVGMNKNIATTWLISEIISWGGAIIEYDRKPLRIFWHFSTILKYLLPIIDQSQTNLITNTTIYILFL